MTFQAMAAKHPIMQYQPAMKLLGRGKKTQVASYKNWCEGQQ
jgi:hypothetical protein